MPVLVGTSGWMYRDWRGVLYPQTCPQRLWLEEYASGFATVESNNAFYRLPSYDLFADWRERTPDGFVMAVKASRYLTHLKRLHDPAEPVHRLLSRVDALGDRLGPILLQLPPNLREDTDSLDACLREFPGHVRVAVEPRHESWWTTGVRRLLERHDAALCWADWYGRPATPLWRTSDWGYLRLHSGVATPKPRYGRQALDTWAGRIADTWPESADVHVYFNNDPGGAAVVNAVQFARAVERHGRTVARVPSLGERG